MKYVISHTTLWSTYKAEIFSELHNQITAEGGEAVFIHTATTDQQRKDLSPPPFQLHDYPYTVLEPGCFEEIGRIRRCLLLSRAIIRAKPDCVLFTGYHLPENWVGACVAKILGAKITIALDSTAIDRAQTFWRRLAKRAFVSLCDAGACYGERSKDLLVSLGMSSIRVVIGCQAAATREINRLMQLHPRRPPPTTLEGKACPLILLYVGRLSQEKNLEFLLTAFRKHLDAHPNWSLVMVGSGPLRAELSDQAACLPQGAILIKSPMDLKGLVDMYRSANLLVLPSLSEPWGLVVNEAMECGLPAIVSNRCGCAETLVVEGVTGFSFDPEDQGSLLKVLAVASEHGRLDKMSRSALANIKNYSSAKAAGKILSAMKISQLN